MNIDAEEIVILTCFECMLYALKASLLIQLLIKKKISKEDVEG